MQNVFLSPLFTKTQFSMTMHRAVCRFHAHLPTSGRSFHPNGIISYLRISTKASVLLDFRCLSTTSVLARSVTPKNSETVAAFSTTSPDGAGVMENAEPESSASGKSRDSSFKTPQSEMVSSVEGLFRHNETLMRLNFTDRLTSYLQMCVFVNEETHAESMLRDLVDENRHWRRFYGKTPHRLGKVSYSPYCILSAEPFNVFLRVHAAKGDTKSCMAILSDMKSIDVDPDALSVALVLAAFGKAFEINTSHSTASLESFIATTANRISDLPLIKLSSRCRLRREEKRLATAALEAAGIYDDEARFDEDTLEGYDRPIFRDLRRSDAKDTTFPNPFYGAFDADKLKTKLQTSFEAAMEAEVWMPRIDRKEVLESKERATTTLDTITLRRRLLEEVGERLRDFEAARRDSLEPNLCPYFNDFTVEEIVEVMVGKAVEMMPWMEYRSKFGVTANFSFEVKRLTYRMGHLLADRSAAKHRLRICGLETIREVHSRLIDFLGAPRHDHPSERLFWREIMNNFPRLADIEAYDVTWPRNVIFEAGSVMMDLLLEQLTVLLSSGEAKASVPTVERGVYSLDRLDSRSFHKNGEWFRTTEISSAVPPVPWLSVDFGGNLLNPSDFIWAKPFNPGENFGIRNIKSVSSMNHLPILDAISHMASCPWRINEFILDVADSLFSRDEPDFGIPPRSSASGYNFRSIEASSMNLGEAERREICHEWFRASKAKADSQRNWCRASFKLSQADYVRDDPFWYPLHLEFRGRIQPVPPYLHLVHMDDDLTRGLMKFGGGKPLGPKGLDWLKIHAINLTGFKKRESNKKRLEFADEVMDDILDSAAHPLDGRLWWTRGDDPWQTLAACKEIADALASPNPANFVSYLPVHQDGTCNGLQHISALARDRRLGEAVNLGISDAPRDVYSHVAEKVERQRSRDAARGLKVARLLEGFVTRKILKKPVMTYYYGVSINGATRQISDVLLDDDEFDKSHLRDCAYYLGKTTLDTLAKMFPAADNLRLWVQEVASLVTQTTGNPMTWVTPLGLPVLLPYFRRDITADVVKQRKRALINLIASLESSHMMLTSLHCRRRGVVFAAVHDCFWTHAADVDAMNEICRRQFVNLYSCPILEDLAKHLEEVNLAEGKPGMSEHSPEKKELLKRKLKNIPDRGNLDLTQVQNSIYFFS